ncbi:MAG: hypothetical protein HY652_15310 [Acidobacteria bacterium]|nr:hypothetical protein [Acidobacteriota bacterium]
MGSRIRSASHFFLALLLGIGIRVGWAQAQATRAPTGPRLSLGISSGASEVEVEVPLTFTPVRGMEAGRIEAQITFPSRTLSFLKVTGYLLSQQEIKIEAKAREVKGHSEDSPTGSVLEISVESASSNKPLPGGVLANLVFTVAKDAQPEVVALGIQAKLWTLTDPPREIKPPELELYEGRINLQEPRVFFGCFFYMH